MGVGPMTRPKPTMISIKIVSKRLAREFLPFGPAFGRPFVSRFWRLVKIYVSSLPARSRRASDSAIFSPPTLSLFLTLTRCIRYRRPSNFRGKVAKQFQQNRHDYFVNKLQSTDRFIPTDFTLDFILDYCYNISHVIN